MLTDVRQYKVAIGQDEDVKVELGQCSAFYVRAGAVAVKIAYGVGQAATADGPFLTIAANAEYARTGITGRRTIYLSAASATTAFVEAWN